MAFVNVGECGYSLSKHALIMLQCSFESGLQKLHLENFHVQAC